MQNLKNTYSELPKGFHRAINPTPVSKPKVLSLNYALANDSVSYTHLTLPTKA